MTHTHENEATLFFQIASELRRAETENADPVQILDLRDEIEAFHRNTSSAFIRERCADLLRRHESQKASQAR